ncbi:MAG: hypothetical protein JKY45_14740 [Emcibacter sp.]|nr:hypothetical protein [Emcibacter sp.]
MIRLGLYITLAIFLALGAVWFADHPGVLQLNWRGWEVRMSVAILCLILLLYTAFCFFLFKLYRWFKTDNPLMSQQRQASRRQKGLLELDLGWSALAIEDRVAALKHGKKALGFLPTDYGPLRLLSKVDTEKNIQKHLQKLMEHAPTRMAALKSKFDQSCGQTGRRDNQKNQENLALLQEMQNITPGNPWIMRRLFDLYTRQEKWDDATAELGRMVKNKTVDAAEQKHLNAVICYSQALEANLANQKSTAQDFARKALKNDPAYVPAAILLGRQYLSLGDKTKARKVIEAIWKVAPHPDLSQFFLKLEPLESPSEKFRRIQKFTKLNADHLHSLHFLAKSALDTEHWTEAKQALNSLVTTGKAHQETYHLLARLEMMQKQDKTASNAMMARAQDVPADPVWQCDACHTRRENYSATCPSCHSFGQIKWQDAQ